MSCWKISNGVEKVGGISLLLFRFTIGGKRSGQLQGMSVLELHHCNPELMLLGRDGCIMPFLPSLLGSLAISQLMIPDVHTPYISMSSFPDKTFWRLIPGELLFKQATGWFLSYNLCWILSKYAACHQWKLSCLPTQTSLLTLVSRHQPPYFKFRFLRH